MYHGWLNPGTCHLLAYFGFRQPQLECFMVQKTEFYEQQPGWEPAKPLGSEETLREQIKMVLMLLNRDNMLGFPLYIHTAL